MSTTPQKKPFTTQRTSEIQPNSGPRVVSTRSATQRDSSAESPSSTDSNSVEEVSSPSLTSDPIVDQSGVQPHTDLPASEARVVSTRSACQRDPSPESPSSTDSYSVEPVSSPSLASDPIADQPAVQLHTDLSASGPQVVSTCSASQPEPSLESPSSSSSPTATERTDESSADSNAEGGIATVPVASFGVPPNASSPVPPIPDSAQIQTVSNEKTGDSADSLPSHRESSNDQGRPMVSPSPASRSSEPKADGEEGQGEGGQPSEIPAADPDPRPPVSPALIQMVKSNPDIHPYYKLLAEGKTHDEAMAILFSRQPYPGITRVEW